MIDYKFTKGATYLVSCSYGCDSMALLSMLLECGIKPVVCFVNYEKEIHGKDERDLSAFCTGKSLVLEVCDAEYDVPPELMDKTNEDFSSWSRKVRYWFFKKIYEKYDAAALFIAHHQDDLLEDYILTKMTNKKFSAYGWNRIAEQNGMIVVRPLLQYSKQDLEDYNRENHVPYSESMSSFEQKYTKDPIRFDVIDKMSAFDRENLLKEMAGERADSKDLLAGITKRIQAGDELDVRELIALNKSEFAETIINYIHAVKPTARVSASTLDDIRALILDKEENKNLDIGDGLTITKEYDVISVGDDLDNPHYSYVMDKPGVIDAPEIYVDFSMGAEDRNVKLDDYPITIRPANTKDLYNVHGFMTPIRRLYVDWRMPPHIKTDWPIIVGRRGNVLYIPRFHRLGRTEHTSRIDIRFIGGIKDE